MMSPGIGAPAPPGVPGSGECQCYTCTSLTKYSVYSVTPL